ncbi:hypothetical protein [Fusibacter tunisiensis]|uniref:Uncharacterized protein n=1 Tax=Fusibacter tunisiensis TaxID=1008308 RepID=A0ABS2MTV0_9FIRM|nr:hypothetical protein [Fusibacter tunisiensis]MBM7562851.1 hypothetical protein [Fusibacter tunisiensis]
MLSKYNDLFLLFQEEEMISQEVQNGKTELSKHLQILNDKIDAEINSIIDVNPQLLYVPNVRHIFYIVYQTL